MGGESGSKEGWVGEVRVGQGWLRVGRGVVAGWCGVQ